MQNFKRFHQIPCAAICNLTLFSLFLGVLCAGPLAGIAAAQSVSVDRDEAVAIVTDTELGGTMDGIRLFVHPRLLPQGESVADWHTERFAAPNRGWFIFVDRYPGANWEHPCWYFFVDSSTGQVQRFDATTPPEMLKDLTELTDGRDNPPPGVSEAALEQYSERLRQLPKPAASRGQAWALIISGGANQSNNHIRYWNDCSFIYRTLVEYYGYADDHIRVCVADGTNPAADRSDGTNSPPDLDGDGDDDIEYPATLSYIDQVFDELAMAVGASDQLFIFTTDHGGQESGQDCYLNLWNSEQLRDDQLASQIASLPCQTIICTFEQCYSGGMIDDLEGDGRVIATAANWDELSWAMGPDYIYDAFVYHWTSAVGFMTPDGTPVDADTNDDGIVSMSEAFIYAEANDQADETPQYSSTPEILGDALNLFGDLDGVYLFIEDMVIDDDNAGASSGDGDGVIDFGETIELDLTLHNMGLSDALNVVGTLASGSPYVTMITSEGGFGSVRAGQSETSVAPFVFSVAGDVPDGEPLLLELAINETPDQLLMSLQATAPAYTVMVTGINDSAGNNNGLADPGEDVVLTLRIDNHGSCDSPSLDVVIHGDGYYFQSDMISRSAGVVPVGGSGTVSGFALQLAPDVPAIHLGLLPVALTAPAAYMVWSEMAMMVGPWFDSVEQDLAWTTGLPGDSATTGNWERIDPIGTFQNSQHLQPENDHTPDPGSICFVTANGIVGGTAGAADVDNGTTTLLSPVFDVAEATSVTLSYWRWYTNNLGNNPGEDFWRVDVTTNGTDWVSLENTSESLNSWNEFIFDIGMYVPLDGTVQFRFIADDQPPGALVEAAVDDITVSIIRPPTTVAVPGDIIGLDILGPCRPNPIGSGATLSFRLTNQTPLNIEVFDLAGRRVKTLFTGPAAAGEHRLDFRAVDQQGRRLAAGMYFVRMATPTTTQVRQMTVIH